MSPTRILEQTQCELEELKCQIRAQRETNDAVALAYHMAEMNGTGEEGALVVLCMALLKANDKLIEHNRYLTTLHAMPVEVMGRA